MNLLISISRLLSFKWQLQRVNFLRKGKDMRKCEIQKKKTIFSKLAATAGALALFAGSAHAQANNFTDAGTNVENTFTLDYEVAGTEQPTITNDTDTTIPGAIVQGSETEFTVDRLIDLVVTQQNSPLTVAPAAQDAALDFLVTNEGNDNQSYSFSIEDVAGDDFDAATYTIEYFVDVDGNGDPFNDPAIAIVETATGVGSTTNVTSDIAPDQTIGVRVTADISGSAEDTHVDDLVLVAQTRDPEDWAQEGASGSQGDITEEDDGTNTDTGIAENVFADGDGAGAEGDTDGLHSDQAQYLVASPDLSASKTVDIVATEPVNCATDAIGGTDQYSVPGACVEYVISVENTGATATAEAIDITDVLPAEVTFVAASINGWEAAPAPTFTQPAASTDCGAATCTVSLSGASLVAGGTGTITIRALVN